MWIALGVLGGLAAAVAGAGWWAPVGMALATVFVVVAEPGTARLGSSRSGVPDGRAPGYGDSRDGDDGTEPGVERGDAVPGGRAAAGVMARPGLARLVDGFGRAARLAIVVLAASTFAAYLVPDHRPAAAVLVVAAVAVADVAGVRLDAYWRRWVGGLLLLAAAAFVAVCLGVSPAPSPVAEPLGGDTPWGVLGGVLSAAAVFVPVLRGRSRRTVVMGAVAALGVAVAALYQLGPLRLGLSTTSLRDTFAAADAQALAPALGAVVTLACLPAALTAFGAASERAHPSRITAVVVPAAVAAIPAALLAPAAAVTVAAMLALAEFAARAAAGPRGPRQVAVVVTAVLLFGGLLTRL
ncbi:MULTISPECIES: hypothetical protein [Prauserella salsuginis group]|uniref:Uncharacterized protein n=1 Tax=Prauserella salsuginis TaxID=387889 RepID=A0ABW6G5L3_9PSEU|nr:MULTISPECIES: hypothetical protein [Prauserella salsuginis group]MCR3719086.1 hypothetical protein [Prauserella flava]MCR3733656.1 hypothetical protein [Prauserella salsuginis]